MFRFTIRDVLWLTVLAAVLMTWWGDRLRLIRRVDESQAQWLEVHTGISRFAR